MEQRLDWRLAVLMAFGFSGCAATSSSPDAPPENRYKVTARVVDIEPQPPAAAAAIPDMQAPAAPKTPAVAARAPLPNPAPDGSRPDEKADPTKADEPRRPVEPAPNPEEQFLLRVASERPAVPLDGFVNGETAVVNFVDGDSQCSRLAISYPARRVSEIWRVCADRQFVLERRAEPVPPVPDDPGLEATRLMTVHSAYTNGHASVPYGPLVVSAQSGGPADARGCMLIRSALSWQGVAMATHDETICPPPDE